MNKSGLKFSLPAERTKLCRSPEEFFKSTMLRKVLVVYNANTAMPTTLEEIQKDPFKAGLVYKFWRRNLEVRAGEQKKEAQLCTKILEIYREHFADRIHYVAQKQLPTPDWVMKILPESPTELPEDFVELLEKFFSELCERYPEDGAVQVFFSSGAVDVAIPAYAVYTVMNNFSKHLPEVSDSNRAYYLDRASRLEKGLEKDGGNSMASFSNLDVPDFFLYLGADGSEQRTKQTRREFWKVIDGLYYDLGFSVQGKQQFLKAHPDFPEILYYWPLFVKLWQKGYSWGDLAG